MIIPWDSLQKYIKFHDTLIHHYVDQYKEDLLTLDELESKMPKAFKKLHEYIAKLLKDNRDPNEVEADALL